MGSDEMSEIASVIKLILSNSSASRITKGRNAGTLSKARYKTDETALSEARSRVSDLLVRFPVYPEIDLKYLKQYFT